MAELWVDLTLAPAHSLSHMYTNRNGNSFQNQVYPPPPKENKHHLPPTPQKGSFKLSAVSDGYMLNWWSELFGKHL